MKTHLHKNKAVIKSATISPYPHLRMGTNLNGKGKKKFSQASISIRGNLFGFGWFLHFFTFLHFEPITQGLIYDIQSVRVTDRLLFHSKCTGFTACLTHSDISLSMYYKSMLNKRWITVPVVNCHPFASKTIVWAISKDLEFADYIS